MRYKWWKGGQERQNVMIIWGGVAADSTLVLCISFDFSPSSATFYKKCVKDEDAVF